MSSRKLCLVVVGLAILPPLGARAAVQFYGDENVLNTGTYPSDPTAGATLEGLVPGDVTAATLIQPHVYPFTPDVGDYPGTDQIYVGSVQTGSHDGYSISPERINGPQNISLDYGDLVPAGQSIQTFTLGIAYDDFQFPAFGNPFTVTVNGQVNATLTSVANSLNEGGPLVQFITAGLDPSILNPSNILSLSIDEGGDGGDGWAIDYLTVGVTTVPEPASFALLGVAAIAGLRRRRRIGLPARSGLEPKR
jgi:PEP-CTERM motif